MSKLEDIQKEIEKLTKEMEELKSEKIMKMYYIDGTNCMYIGDVGHLSNIKDSNGEFLHTGDVVRFWEFSGEDMGTKSVCYCEEDNKTFIPGIKDLPENVREKLIILEKIKDYKDVRKGFRTYNTVYAYTEDEAKEIMRKERKVKKEALENMSNEDKKVMAEIIKEMIN